MHTEILQPLPPMDMAALLLVAAGMLMVPVAAMAAVVVAMFIEP